MDWSWGKLTGKLKRFSSSPSIDTWWFPEKGAPPVIQLLGYPHDYGNPHTNPYWSSYSVFMDKKSHQLVRYITFKTKKHVSH